MKGTIASLFPIPFPQRGLESQASKPALKSSIWIPPDDVLDLPKKSDKATPKKTIHKHIQMKIIRILIFFEELEFK